jgi:hypothetical protein
MARCHMKQACCSVGAPAVCCGRKRRLVNVRLIAELLRQVPYLVPRYFT